MAVYLDEVDVSSQVQGLVNTPTTDSVGVTANMYTPKILTFTEPPVGTSLLAIKFYENSEVQHARLLLKCVSTDPESPWNFESRPNTNNDPDGWWTLRSASLTAPRTDYLTPDWYKKEYVALTANDALNLAKDDSDASLTPTHVDRMVLNTDQCGAIDKSLKIKAYQPSGVWYVAARKQVTKTSDPCAATPEPTAEPTAEPTPEPTPPPTFQPTLPPTFAPTKQPTSQPTLCSGTGWAKSSASTCFLDDGFTTRWGWTNGPVSYTVGSTKTFDIWVSAAKCDTTKGFKAGSGTIKFLANKQVTITTAITVGTVTGVIKAYVGNTKYYPTNEVSPGALPISVTSNSFTTTVSTLDMTKPVYYYIHYDVASSC
jgi:hypothetical protein